MVTSDLRSAKTQKSNADVRDFKKKFVTYNENERVFFFQYANAIFWEAAARPATHAMEPAVVFQMSMVR